MVYRIYVEKKPGFDVEATGLKNELTRSEEHTSELQSPQ